MLPMNEDEIANISMVMDHEDSIADIPPAPWTVKSTDDVFNCFVADANGHTILLPENDNASGYAAILFAANARNAMEIMQNNRWWPVPFYSKWHVHAGAGVVIDRRGFDDPIVAILQAEDWHSKRRDILR